MIRWSASLIVLCRCAVVAGVLEVFIPVVAARVAFASAGATRTAEARLAGRIASANGLSPSRGHEREREIRLG
jgi:hypothetical protein